MTATVPSVRQAALALLVSRVELISVANGYQTNAGEHVSVGETVTLGPDDPEASIAVLIAPDAPGHQMENVVVELPLEVAAVVREGSAVLTEFGRYSWFTVEAIVADIKRAVEQDRNLGGTVIELKRGPVRPFDREAGSEFVGAGVEYVLKYVERWGQP